MSASLVGSEMCIRDSSLGLPDNMRMPTIPPHSVRSVPWPLPASVWTQLPVSYTHLTLPTICSV
eukprot:14904059-Alexandrium_andersonii.AAC.1